MVIPTLDPSCSLNDIIRKDRGDSGGGGSVGRGFGFGGVAPSSRRHHSLVPKRRKDIVETLHETAAELGLVVRYSRKCGIGKVKI